MRHPSQPSHATRQAAPSPWALNCNTIKPPSFYGTPFSLSQVHACEILHEDPLRLNVARDIRSSPTKHLKYNEVHSDDITELRFHPSQAPNILLSGSTDGLVNVYDTRIADEDDVIVQTLNHGSVHHTAFLSASEVYALSHDEKFAVFNLDEEHEKGTPVADFGDVRSELNCQYVANVTTKLDGSGAIVGVGSQE